MAHSEAANYRLSSYEAKILIDMYRSRPCLWQKKHEDYRNRRLKLESYKAILKAFHAASGIHLPMSVLKTKLFSFRTMFIREFGIMLKATQAGKSYKPKYEHYDRLSFLKSVVKAPGRSQKGGSDSSPKVEEGMSEASNLQDLEDLPDFQVYNASPGPALNHSLGPAPNHSLGPAPNHDDELDDSMSCDLSCDSASDDKTALHSLLEQNGIPTPQKQKGPLSDASHQNRDRVGSGDDASLTFRSKHNVRSQPQGADEEVFSPLLRAQKKIAQLRRQDSNRRGKKRRQHVNDDNVEDDECSEDLDVNFPHANREEDEEVGSNFGVNNKLVDCLVEAMNRRDRRREEWGGETEDGQSGDMVWAKYIVQQINEIGSEKKRQQLKLKISQLVIESCLEETGKQ